MLSSGRDTIYGEEHVALRRSLRAIIDREINPHIDEWERDGIWPGKKICAVLAEAGLLGLTKSVEYGGSGLDYTYAIAMAEEMGHCKSGGVPMAVGVVTDMATPALDKHGSDELRRNFCLTIAGECFMSECPRLELVRCSPAQRQGAMAMILSSTAERCGLRTERRQIGCASSQTPPMDCRTGTNLDLFAYGFSRHYSGQNA